MEYSRHLYGCMYAISESFKHGPEQRCTQVTALALPPLAVLAQLTAVGTCSFIPLPFCSGEQKHNLNIRFTSWNGLHALLIAVEFPCSWLKFSSPLSGVDSVPLSLEPPDSDSPDPAQPPGQQPPSLLSQPGVQVQSASRSPSPPVFTAFAVLLCLNCLAK